MQEQKELLAGQNRLMNELQTLCEFTQNDIIKANRDLNKKKIQKKQINLAYQEVDQSTVTLKNRHGLLENQMNTLRQSLSPKKQEQEDDQKENTGLNQWGKPMSPGKKIRSINSMFSAQTGFDKQ